MKTPREILLARHRAAEDRLDAIRHAVVAELNNQGTKEQSQPTSLVASLLGCFNQLWLELFWPSRRTWAGLAAAWLVILAVNLAQRDPAPSAGAPGTPVMMSLAEQQHWLNQLFADRLPAADMERPRKFSPQPRTEIFEFVIV